MNIKALRYFLKVCEHGSESSAAKSLHIAQPALSAQIRKLELELGVQLFHRSSRGMDVAEAGTRFAKHAGEILGAIQRAEEEMHSLRERPLGTVTVGFGISVSNMLAIPLIELMKERHPGITVHIIETMNGFLREWLVTGRLDLGVLYNVENQDGMICEILLQEPLHLIGPRGSHFGQGPVNFNALSGVPLVLPSKLHNLRLALEQQAKKHGFRLNVAYEIDAMPQLIKLVERNMGHSVLSLAMVQDEISQGTLVSMPIVRPSISRSVVLARSQRWSRAAEVVHSEITRLVADLVKTGHWKSESALSSYSE